MNGQTFEGHCPIRKERWPPSSPPHQEKPEVLHPGAAEISSPPHRRLPPAPLASRIPVGLERLLFVVGTHINLQPLGLDFTLCCVHKLISWD